MLSVRWATLSKQAVLGASSLKLQGRTNHEKRSIACACRRLSRIQSEACRAWIRDDLQRDGDRVETDAESFREPTQWERTRAFSALAVGMRSTERMRFFLLPVNACTRTMKAQNARKHAANARSIARMIVEHQFKPTALTMQAAARHTSNQVLRESDGGRA